MNKYILEPVSTTELATPANAALFVDTALAGMPDSGLQAEEITQALATGRLQGWKLGEATEDGVSLAGTAITEFQVTPVSGTKVLYIMALKLSPRTAVEGMAAFVDQAVEFAKANGCARIEALTKSKAVLRVAKSTGFNADWRLLAKEV